MQWSHGSFGTVFDPKENSFGFLRLLFAWAVLFSHSFVLGGLGAEPLLEFSGGRINLGRLSVFCFFAVSGFLIMRSRALGRSWASFLWARFLRIFPGYWCCLAVTVLFFVPLYCWLEGRAIGTFFTENREATLGYLSRNARLAIHQWGIPPLLSGVPYREAIDGSLWSLVYEWRCYLLVTLLGFLPEKRGLLKSGVLLFAAWTWFASIAHAHDWSIAGRLPLRFHDPEMARLGIYFFSSAVIFLFRERIPNSRVLFAVTWIFTMAGIHLGGVVQYLMPWALSYCVLWLAFNLPKKLSWFDRAGDVSYGLYVYAFPVQQALAAAGVHRFGLAIYVVTATAITLALAILSYRLVEMPALRWKTFDPTFGFDPLKRVRKNPGFPLS